MLFRSRFIGDILHNAWKMDLGLLNPVVEFSFLNFSVIVFFVCVGLMIGVSKMGEPAGDAKTEGLTMEWSRMQFSHAEVAMTVGVLAAVVGLWTHFA